MPHFLSICCQVLITGLSVKKFLYGGYFRKESIFDMIENIVVDIA